MLAKRYGNTITSTLWRIVEDRDPDTPVFGMVTIHPRHPTIGANDSGDSVRYFIRSLAFRQQFPNFSSAEAFSVLSRHASWKKSGPIMDIQHAFHDVNGEVFEFRIESFSNSHALLTYGVLLFEPGSDQSPFHFNPLDLEGIDPGHHKTYIRQIIELFIDSYLEDLKLLTVQGVESLLLRAVDELLIKQKALTFPAIYDWICRFEGRFREMDWKATASNLLYKLTTGPLGNVMQGPSLKIEWLIQQKAIFELNNVGNSKDKSFFIRTLLLRLYYHFRNQGASETLKLLVTIEEAHNILLRKGTGYETIIELMLRECREFGLSFIIIDQHPASLSLPSLGVFCTISFNSS